MKAIYDVPAPAKLNLFLHVIGQRADGYHLIQSVFMLIDWCDTLHFELRSDGLIARTDIGPAKTNILPTNDLTVRAAQALKQACGTTSGVQISLDKRIPAEAGMGGGSSDAASCLLALQRLWGVKLPHSELLAIALSLGADVPFFLFGGNAWVEGVGEQVAPVILPSADFLVMTPPLGVSTPTIFASPALKRDTETATISGFATNSETRIFEFGHNDLQPVAQQFCPQIIQSLDWLTRKQLRGRMTGTGSAVFAPLAHEVNISDHPEGFVVRKCSNLQVHPLAGW